MTKALRLSQLDPDQTAAVIVRAVVTHIHQLSHALRRYGSISDPLGATPAAPAIPSAREEEHARAFEGASTLFVHVRALIIFAQTGDWGPWEGSPDAFRFTLKTIRGWLFGSVAEPEGEGALTEESLQNPITLVFIAAYGRLALTESAQPDQAWISLLSIAALASMTYDGAGKALMKAGLIHGPTGSPQIDRVRVWLHKRGVRGFGSYFRALDQLIAELLALQSVEAPLTPSQLLGMVTERPEFRDATLASILESLERVAKLDGPPINLMARQCLKAGAPAS